MSEKTSAQEKGRKMIVDKYLENPGRFFSSIAKEFGKPPSTVNRVTKDLSKLRALCRSEEMVEIEVALKRN